MGLWAWVMGVVPLLSSPCAQCPQNNFMPDALASFLLPDALPKFWKNQEITMAEKGTVLSKTKSVS